MREFLDPYDKRLNLYSKELTLADLTSTTVKSVMHDMRRIAIGERDEGQPNKGTLVGLSAPQLGVFKRVILIDVAADPLVANFVPDLKLFVNPRIVEASTTENLGREGCFSTGKIGGAVLRADSVTVRALDEEGNEFTHKSSNLFQSRILQHEIDHLDGIRFPSRIRNPKHLHFVDMDDFQNYRENWETWTKLYPIEKWFKMYEGRPDHGDI